MCNMFGYIHIKGKYIVCVYSITPPPRFPESNYHELLLLGLWKATTTNSSSSSVSGKPLPQAPPPPPPFPQSDYHELLLVFWKSTTANSSSSPGGTSGE